MAYLDVDSDQSQPLLLRIERYVTINALEYVGETDSDLDDATPAPTLSVFLVRNNVPLSYNYISSQALSIRIQIKHIVIGCSLRLTIMRQA